MCAEGPGSCAEQEGGAEELGTEGATSGGRGNAPAYVLANTRAKRSRKNAPNLLTLAAFREGDGAESAS